MSWPKRDLFAVTVDGKVLMNAAALDDAELENVVRRKGVFVGVLVSKREVRLLLRRLAEASSETAAYISGGRSKRRRRPSR